VVNIDGREYPVRKDSEAFKEFKATREAKIHGIYEETMLEIGTAAVLDGVDKILGSPRAPKLTVGMRAARVEMPPRSDVGELPRALKQSGLLAPG
jgi:hypothetical protein